MAKKLLHVGHFTYTIVETEDTDAQAVAESVQAAMDEGDVCEIAVLDENDRQLTLYLNGRTVDVVVFDHGLGPRPTEISRPQEPPRDNP
ncbi:hypothetical protein Ade02nite_47070 [Paractinoplanes deccanensis]|uniref:Uncharacterized protein n=1 Tax=Paractinoplanes deccanensis TaxID=113561 RepID=A0ABQ3Y7W3_9ACTN|nr:hypothetical protein [Actinoplanes deccanensis]GID76066.1 hypothetical protein Ade02nite_47070 [Actinoplanes deccanensis]